MFKKLVIIGIALFAVIFALPVVFGQQKELPQTVVTMGLSQQAEAWSCPSGYDRWGHDGVYGVDWGCKKTQTRQECRGVDLWQINEEKTPETDWTVTSETMIEQNSQQCGYQPPPPQPEPIYRWNQTCDGTTLFKWQEVSHDNGVTWTEVPDSRTATENAEECKTQPPVNPPVTPPVPQDNGGNPEGFMCASNFWVSYSDTHDGDLITSPDGTQYTVNISSTESSCTEFQGGGGGEPPPPTWNCDSPMAGYVTCDQKIRVVTGEFVVGNPDPFGSVSDVTLSQFRRGTIYKNGVAVTSVKAWENEKFPRTVSYNWFYGNIAIGDRVQVHLVFKGWDRWYDIPVVDAANGFGNPASPAMITADDNLYVYPGQGVGEIAEITKYSGDPSELKSLWQTAHLNTQQGVATEIPADLKAKMGLFAPATKTVAQSSSSVTYTVQSGDTLSGICVSLGATQVYGDGGCISQLKSANSLTSSTLTIGQVLTIPSSMSGS